MNGPGSDSNSDDTDDEVDTEEEDVYRRKYQLLLERCEVLQQVNNITYIHAHSFIFLNLFDQFFQRLENIFPYLSLIANLVC